MTPAQLAGIIRTPDGLATRGHYELELVPAVVPNFDQPLNVDYEIESAHTTVAVFDASIETEAEIESRLTTTAEID